MATKKDFWELSPRFLGDDAIDDLSTGFEAAIRKVI